MIPGLSAQFGQGIFGDKQHVIDKQSLKTIRSDLKVVNSTFERGTLTMKTADDKRDL